MADGTSAVIHLNRLKRAHQQAEGDILPTSMKTNKAIKLKKFRKIVSKECEDTEIRSHPQVLYVVSTGSKSSEDSDEDRYSSPRRRREDPEWKPRSSYLRVHRLLQGNGKTVDVAYRLRSRLVSRSGRETETDKEQAEAVRSTGSDHMISDTRNITSPGKFNLASFHSNNLRSSL